MLFDDLIDLTHDANRLAEADDDVPPEVVPLPIIGPSSTRSALATYSHDRIRETVLDSWVELDATEGGLGASCRLRGWGDRGRN